MNSKEEVLHNLKFIPKDKDKIDYLVNYVTQQQPTLEQLRDEIIKEILKIEEVEDFTRFDSDSIYVDGNTFCYKTPNGIEFDYNNLTPELYILIANYFMRLESE